MLPKVQLLSGLQFPDGAGGPYPEIEDSIDVRQCREVRVPALLVCQLTLLGSPRVGTESVRTMP